MDRRQLLAGFAQLVASIYALGDHLLRIFGITHPELARTTLIDAYMVLPSSLLSSITLMMMSVTRFRKEYGQHRVELHTSRLTWSRLCDLFAQDLQATGVGHLVLSRSSPEALLRDYFRHRDIELHLHADAPEWEHEHCAAELYIRDIPSPRTNHEQIQDAKVRHPYAWTA